jgi:hypothetical protein
VHEVFGAGSLGWRLVPTAMVLPGRLKDDILGYALPTTLEPSSDTDGGGGGGSGSKGTRGEGSGEDGSGEGSGSSSSAEGSSGDDSGSESEAMARCRPLAEGGDPQAMLHLAIMYDEGRVAVRNTQRAKRWLKRAASGVNAEAAFRLVR